MRWPEFPPATGIHGGSVPGDGVLRFRELRRFVNGRDPLLSLEVGPWGGVALLREARGPRGVGMAELLRAGLTTETLGIFCGVREGGLVLYIAELGEDIPSSSCIGVCGAVGIRGTSGGVPGASGWDISD
jgi:hypothetical protein